MTLDDALYADDSLLAWLKYQRNVDALVRLPEDCELYADLVGLLRLQPKRWRTHTDVRDVAGHKTWRSPKRRCGDAGCVRWIVRPRIVWDFGTSPIFTVG